MAGIHVYLENGFDHDRVTICAGGEEREHLDVTTRYQVGLASVVELTVPDGAPTVVRIAVPGRGLTAETTVDPQITPHLRANVTDRSLVVQLDAVPPRFA